MLKLKEIKNEAKRLNLDKGIKELVIGLNYHGIRTTNSCQGHEKTGLNYPFIDISAKDGSKLFEMVRWFNFRCIEKKLKTILFG